MTNEQLMTFASQLVARASILTRLGSSYSGNRDLYQALGYTEGELKFTDFYVKYIRHDIAKAVIDRPVRATWQGKLELLESEEENDTEFEKAWGKLNRLIGIKTKLSRLDRLTGIGRYGILLLGLDDVTSREGFGSPVAKGARKLTYIKPFGENNAPIAKFENNPKNPRYGLPLYYDIHVQEADNGVTSQVRVHHSRIVHITDEPLESDVYGTPRLEAVYNRLMDIEKLVGGDAEMFWRGARPGYEGKVAPEYTLTEEMRTALKDQIDEYEHNLRRFLINEGIDIQALQQQVSDPKSHFEVQISCVSAVTGIPQRVLMGSERGELASTQDTSEWKEYVQARREDHAEPNIVRPLVDRLIEYKILPQPKEDYTVKWNDLYSLSEKARVEIGKTRATALREYTYTPMAEAIVPPKAFFEKFLGFTTEEITLITKMQEEMISQEDLYDKIIKELDPPEPVQPAAGGGVAPKKSKPSTAPTKTPMRRAKQ